MLKRNRIYLEDCFEFLSKVQAKSVDLAIIDPPYNLRKDQWDSFKNRDEFLLFTYRWIDLLLPTLKENGSLYVFNTPLHCAFIATHLLGRGLNFRNWITWDKRDGFVSGTRRFVSMQETILYFANGADPYFDADSVRVPYESSARIAHAKKKGILKNGKRWFPNEKGKLCTDVWHIASERHKSKQNGRVVKGIHATPKPFELIERIVLASSRPGDLVLDCFAGTGTTAVAAKKHGRDFLACDSNPDYVRYAEGRLANGGEEHSGC